MSKDLENVLKKIENLIKIGRDGKEHQSLITKEEAKALDNYIKGLRIQLSATEELAAELQRKYENKIKDDEIENLFDLK